VTHAEVVAKVALPEETRLTPVSGYLYFPYAGQLKRMKRVELVCKTPAGSLVLLLR
jgi:hypothetical protein